MKYNKILAEFEFLVDLDMAIFKYIKEEFNNPQYVNQGIINLNDENEIIKLMLYRDNIDPLVDLLPECDTLPLYKDIMDNKMEDLLKYAKVSDIFCLMVTFLREATSISIDILCESQAQSDFIKSLNPELNTIIKSRQNVPVDNYDIFYIKNYPNVLLYPPLRGKHIYIAYAKYNMEPKKNVPLLSVSVLCADINIVHSIDLYTKIKYEKEKKDE